MNQQEKIVEILKSKTCKATIGDVTYYTLNAYEDYLVHIANQILTAIKDEGVKCPVNEQESELPCARCGDVGELMFVGFGNEICYEPCPECKPVPPEEK